MPSPVVGGQVGRTDQGVDVAAVPGSGAKILDPVPGLSKAVGIISNWYRGQPYQWFQVLTGKFKGRFWYGAEEINFSTKPGDVVQGGQQIGTYAASGTGTEFGWATASGQTLAQATGGYTEGQATPAGLDFRSRIIGLKSAAGAAWKPCLLTWYDPSLGGINSSHGQADPHAATASGEPYSASADTCAAPPGYKFGTIVTFSYNGATVTCKVNDRGGAIIGNHFDLSRHAAETLGIIGAGAVNAQFVVGTVGAGSAPAYGGTRPGGTPAPGSSDGPTSLLDAYTALVDLPRTAPADYAGLGTLGPVKWWWQSFSGKWGA